MSSSQRRVGSETTDFGDSLIRISPENSVEHPTSSTHLGVTKRNGVGEKRQGLRLRHLAGKIEQALDVRIAERTRLARELHDTLLQSFYGVLFQLRTVGNLLPTRPAEAKDILRKAIVQAAEAVTEGRKAVQGLRTSPAEHNDLTAAIGALAERLAADPATSHGASLRVCLEGTVRPLHPVIRDEICRIAEEALRNALQHSQGTQIEVEVRYDKQRFRLHVRDNGRGIDASVLADGGRDAHFGLCGMRERAELIGGKLNVWSGRDTGTEIELTVAASRVYANGRAARSNPTSSGATPPARAAPDRGCGCHDSVALTF